MAKLIFKSVYELNPAEVEHTILGMLDSNITPQMMFDHLVRSGKVDPTFTLESYADSLMLSKKDWDAIYRTKSGYLVVDATRKATIPQWTIEECIGVLKGELGTDQPGSWEHRRTLAIDNISGQLGINLRDWHEDDIKKFIFTYKSPSDYGKPFLTKRGNPEKSPKYTRVSPYGWTHSELQDGLEGFLRPAKEVDPELLLEQVRLEYRLPIAWDRDEVINHIVNGITPPKASNGVWVNDVTREYMEINQVPFWDLQAALRGEIDLVYTEVEILVECKRRLQIPNLPDDIVKQQVKSMEKKDLDKYNYIDVAVEDFIQALKASRGVDPKVAAAGHHALNNMFNKVIRLPLVEFTVAYGILLDHVAKNLTTWFADDKVFGGCDEMTIPPAAYRFYELFLSTIVRTANPTTRYVNAKATSIETIAKVAPVKELDAKLREFYNLD